MTATIQEQHDFKYSENVDKMYSLMLDFIYTCTSTMYLMMQNFLSFKILCYTALEIDGFVSPKDSK